MARALARRRSAAVMGAVAAAAAGILGVGCGDTSKGTTSRHTTSGPHTGTMQRTASTHPVPAPGRDTFTHVSLRGTGHMVTVPSGWQAELWAHVDDARLEAWTPNGSLLVSSPKDGTVTELTPHGGASPSSRTIVSGLTYPQGLAFDTLHGATYLYVAASNALMRYRWTRTGAATDRRTLVANLPDKLPAGDDVHRYKEVVVGDDHTIYVDIGSSSNATIPSPPPHGTLPRASVIAFNSNGTLKRIQATGVRNGDGLAIAPDGALWTAVNERDQIAYPFHRSYDGHGDAFDQVIPSYVDNHPPDELARLTPGRNLGWPYCDPDPDVHPGAFHTAYDYANMPFTADAQTNPGSRRMNCAKLTRIERGLPAHSAPLGMSFLVGSKLPARWAGGAVVAGHGSWDREPPRPPVVYWLPWDSRSHTLGRAIVLISGFQAANGSRWGRLADAVPGPDGSLYVTDDQSGAVYRFTP